MEVAEITPVVQSGDYQRALEALRDKLAIEIDDCHDGTKVAALAKQLRDVLTTLKSMNAGQEGSAVDELAARRKDRRSKASPGAAAGVDGSRGGH